MPINTASADGSTPHAPEPQPVLAPLTISAGFLVVSVCDGADMRVLDVASDINSLVRAIGFRAPELQLSCVVGIGPAYWDRIRPYDAPRPMGLHPFKALTGAQHDAPSTAGDLLFHIRANRADLTFELARQIMDALGADVAVEDYVTGLRYFETRDMLGFVDGTENPTGPSAAIAAVIGPDGEHEFAGGSYVVVQKYVHDLETWNAMDTEEQERVIGRTKLDDIELADDVQPTNSHVTLNTIEDADGTERDIVRANMAFGDAGTGEYGTYYIAYAADISVIEQMLVNMFEGDPPGNYDRILDVSTAVTGTQFFVPALDMLESLAEEMADGQSKPLEAESQPVDLEANGKPRNVGGSLSIGSLKGVSQ